MSRTTAGTDHRIEIERVLNAPRERVYRAWTDPEEMLKWWQATEIGAESVEVDARVGGRFRIQMRGSAGAPLIVIGTFMEVEPPRRLVHTWLWEGGGPSPGEESEVTVTFEDLGGRTRMRLVHARFATRKNAEDHERGWAGKIEGFVAYVDALVAQGGTAHG